MKVLSIDEAQAHLGAVCDEVIAGQTIHLVHPSGQLLVLAPLPGVLEVETLSEDELAACYKDDDWFAFENNCGKASH